MTDPRSLATGATTWLTDSRVYNLIWLERTGAITRAVSVAARRVAATGEVQLSLDDALVPAARAAGVQTTDKTRLAS